MSMHQWITNATRNLFRRKHIESDLDAELQAWADLAAQRKIRSGMNDSEARRAVLVESGGLEQVKDRVRDARAGNGFDTLLRDLRFGARLLLKDRAFTATALIMLALGIGANTAVFSVLHTLLLRGLPYCGEDRIMMLYEKRPREDNWNNVVSPPDFLDWRSSSRSFEAMAAVVHDTVTWQSDSGAEQIMAGIVSPEFFAVLGVRPAIGAGFRPESAMRDGNEAVVLTHGFWQRRFGGDSALVGRSVTINGIPREVAGILPAGFEYPVQDVDVILPLWFRSRENLNRTNHVLNVVAKLKPGVSLGAAQSEMDGVAARLEQQYPSENRGHGVHIVSLKDVLLGPLRKPLLVLQTAVLFVLLIACGNLANLLLARTFAREREISVRLALGSGRGRVFRQLLCESTLLAVIGGGIGIAVAYGALPLLQVLIPPDLPVLRIRDVQADTTVLATCVLLSVLCGLFFGVAPAWRGSGFGVAAILKEAATGGGRRTQRWRNMLVAVQIALAVVLLTGAALALRQFMTLRSADPGFRAHGVLTAQASVPGSRYKDAASVVRLTSEWLDAVRRLPGVQAAGITSHLPVSGMDGRRGLAIEGVPVPDPNQPRRAHIRWASPGYFESMGVRIVRGRAFTDSDTATAVPVAIVNETAARKYFPNGDAIGRRVKPGGSTGPWSEVVGVIADVRHWGLDVEPRPEQYYCHLQQATWMTNITVRVSGDPASLATAVRDALHRLDRGIPLARVQTMEEAVSRSIGTERAMLVLLGLFAGIAVLLTAAGVYGTMVYLLSQQRREIGIRLALGATNSVILRAFAVRQLMYVGAGLAIGIVAAATVTRFGSADLFGPGASDLLSYAPAPLAVLAVGAAATYFPARRLLRAGVYDALRHQ